VAGSGGMGGSVTNAPGPISWGGSPGGTNAATDGSVQAGFQAVVNQLRQLSLGLTNGFVLSVSNTVSVSTSNLNQEVTQLGVSNNLGRIEGAMTNHFAGGDVSTNFASGVGSLSNAVTSALSGYLGTNQALGTALGTPGSGLAVENAHGLLQIVLPGYGISAGLTEEQRTIDLDPASNPVFSAVFEFVRTVFAWMLSVGFLFAVKSVTFGHMEKLTRVPQREIKSIVGRAPIISTAGAAAIAVAVIVMIGAIGILGVHLIFEYGDLDVFLGTIFASSGSSDAWFQVLIYYADLLFPFGQFFSQLGFFAIFSLAIDSIYMVVAGIIMGLTA